MEDLSAAGLNLTEAKSYKALLTRKSWLPSELAQSVSETRTNMYKILDKLIALGLAERLSEQKKFQYRAMNPARLLELARELHASRERAKEGLELTSQSLMHEYIKSQEQAGIHQYQGKIGMQAIFDDMIKTAKPIYLLRSTSDVEFYDEAFFTEFRMRRASANITTHALTPDVSTAIHDQSTDTANKFIRTWLPPKSYTSPVEWDAYGDKLAIISYGMEATGTIIESAAVAESFRQLCRLLSSNQRELAAK